MNKAVWIQHNLLGVCVCVCSYSSNVKLCQSCLPPTNQHIQYRNYSNKRRGVKKDFGASGAAFIQGRRLFE